MTNLERGGKITVRVTEMREYRQLVEAYEDCVNERDHEQEYVTFLETKLRRIAEMYPETRAVVGRALGEKPRRQTLEGKREVSDLARLREALKAILLELGVPNEGYPAPVIAAESIARNALKETT